MSDAPESQFPFGSFSTTGGFDMLEKMWRMMQVPGLGGTPGGPSSMMSSMMAPMTNIEDLDKRITDMRAVEQWLKLNLSMLQSAIQALEVQRATLATLKAFGAFAKTSMEQAAAATPTVNNPFGPTAVDPHSAASAKTAASAEPAASTESTKTASDDNAATGAAAAAAGQIDPTVWWNLLQTQFNQIAGMALAAQQGANPAHATGAATGPQASTSKDTAGKAPAKKSTEAAAKKPGIKKTHASTTAPDVPGDKPSDS
ncbi:PhaM family polyhydroxyalkanoate granule multifunctional regulatory protein [Burkholderia sp. L27(2015)]|uniref:PhaM family polyhydroxyalkanoate granule multifunctional regulatory protein n=1 Tax=Burkholderia sp. L27(2015) TaxID=1641858 RepID=UPI00131BEC0B|nr:PhaM family polyhydroxyalkanoate granule multifunctional regulatory protein [Burkholderia sp. L27(2015)]